MKKYNKVLAGLILAGLTIGVSAFVTTNACEADACGDVCYSYEVEDDSNYDYWEVDESYYFEEVNEENIYEYQYSEYSANDLMTQGRIYWGGYEWTWYSQNVLPGYGLDIQGRYVDENGYVCDGNDNICLASSELDYGTIVATPFGKDGCVYDSGCAYGMIDVYTAW